MADFDFIRLTFDGVKTSDLNLYVVSNSGRYTTSLSPQFENRTTSVPGRPGLLYWGTDLGAQELTIQLATDGITGTQLNKLKKLFVPGKLGTLSFEESSYREYKVMLLAPSSMNFVPFIKTEASGYPTSLYKGEIELQLTTLEPYGYSITGLYTGSLDNPSRLESGLPRLADFPATTTTYHISHNIRVQNRATTANKAQNVNSVYISHAGNAEGELDLIFTKTYTLSAESGSTGPRSSWVNITIDDAILVKPRFIVDIEFALQEVYSAWPAWSTKKASVLNTLREELNGSHRDTLINLVNATGSGLTYSTFPGLKQKIQTDFFTNVKYRFRIQGTTNQCGLEITNTAGTSVLYTEDNAGSFNGKFIKLKAGGILPVVSNQQILTSSVPISDVEVKFKDTYI